MNGSDEGLNELLSSPEVSLTETNPLGQTALHLAVCDPDLIEILLQNDDLSRHVNTEDNLGRTPLEYAIVLSNLESICILFEAGADPNRFCTDKGGEIWYSLMRRHHTGLAINLLGLLCSHLPEDTIRQISTCFAFRIMLMNSQEPYQKHDFESEMRSILNIGIDRDFVTDRGNSLLHLVESAPIGSLLLDHDIQHINSRNRD